MTAREARRPPPWIFPPEDFEPFIFSSPPASPVLDVEIQLGTFVTRNRWLRIATMELSHCQRVNNYLRMVGPGWGDLAEFMPFGGDGTGFVQPLEFPVFCILPPTSQHAALYLGQGATDLTWRVTGWYF